MDQLTGDETVAGADAAISLGLLGALGRPSPGLPIGSTPTEGRAGSVVAFAVMSASMPRLIPPMLAKLSASLPSSDERWAYEMKWDGIRGLAFIEHASCDS